MAILSLKRKRISGRLHLAKLISMLLKKTSMSRLVLTLAKLDL
jgi:hypothetical protein